MEKGKEWGYQNKKKPGRMSEWLLQILSKVTSEKSV